MKVPFARFRTAGATEADEDPLNQQTNARSNVVDRRLWTAAASTSTCASLTGTYSVLLNQ